jgi:hypothetical protein
MATPLVEAFAVSVVVVFLAIFVVLSATYWSDYFLSRCAKNNWRFSVRTLLITTTLFAVLLGTAPYWRVW